MTELVNSLYYISGLIRQQLGHACLTTSPNPFRQEGLQGFPLLILGQALDRFPEKREQRSELTKACITVRALTCVCVC